MNKSKIISYLNLSKHQVYREDFNLEHVFFKKGDFITVEFFTDSKYKHIFSGICIKKTKSNKVLIFNIKEKMYSTFFLYSPNIVKFSKNKL